MRELGAFVFFSHLVIVSATVADRSQECIATAFAESDGDAVVDVRTRGLGAVRAVAAVANDDLDKLFSCTQVSVVTAILRSGFRKPFARSRYVEFSVKTPDGEVGALHHRSIGSDPFITLHWKHIN